MSWSTYEFTLLFEILSFVVVWHGRFACQQQLWQKMLRSRCAAAIQAARVYTMTLLAVDGVLRWSMHGEFSERNVRLHPDRRSLMQCWDRLSSHFCASRSKCCTWDDVPKVCAFRRLWHHNNGEYWARKLQECARKDGARLPDSKVDELVYNLTWSKFSVL